MCGSHSELLEARRHRVVLVCFARLARAPSPIVLADAPPSALPALAPVPSVLADARPSALLALAPYPIVLADACPCPSAGSALVPLPIVLADAHPSALLAPSPYPIVPQCPDQTPSLPAPPPLLSSPLLPQRTPARAVSSRDQLSVSAAKFAAPSLSASRSVGSMISLGAAVPVLAPLHASIVCRSHVAHCPAYFVPVTHAQWTGLELHCQHLSAAVPRTDSEQKPHAYVK